MTILDFVNKYWIPVNLFWVVLTAIVTTAARKPSPEFCLKYPRVAAFRRMLSDAGLNLPNLMKNLFILVTGRPPLFGQKQVAPVVDPDKTGEVEVSVAVEPDQK